MLRRVDANEPIRGERVEGIRRAGTKQRDAEDGHRGGARRRVVAKGQYTPEQCDRAIQKLTAILALEP